MDSSDTVTFIAAAAPAAPAAVPAAAPAAAPADAPAARLFPDMPFTQAVADIGVHAFERLLRSCIVMYVKLADPATAIKAEHKDSKAFYTLHGVVSTVVCDFVRCGNGTSLADFMTGSSLFPGGISDGDSKRVGDAFSNMGLFKHLPRIESSERSLKDILAAVDDTPGDVDLGEVDAFAYANQAISELAECPDGVTGAMRRKNYAELSAFYLETLRLSLRAFVAVSQFAIISRAYTSDLAKTLSMLVKVLMETFTPMVESVELSDVDEIVNVLTRRGRPITAADMAADPAGTEAAVADLCRIWKLFSEGPVLKNRVLSTQPGWALKTFISAYGEWEKLYESHKKATADTAAESDEGSDAESSSSSSSSIDPAHLQQLMQLLQARQGGGSGQDEEPTQPRGRGPHSGRGGGSGPQCAPQ